MSVSLDKKTGINLQKGNSISLEKDGNSLNEVCIGLNWGAIKKKVFFGLLNDTESVDLDCSVTMFSKTGHILDTVYYHNLTSYDGAIKHSGDDRIGDEDSDDFDNEVIQIVLSRVNPDVEQIVFYLNSYKGQDFASIPYSKIRIFETLGTETKNVFATFNLSADTGFAGQISMVMGKLYRHANKWDFKAIGEAIPTKRISDTEKYIQEKYL